MAQQCTLDPSDSPAAQLVTTRHAADSSTPETWVKIGYRDQQALGMVLQLHSSPDAVCRAPKQNIRLYFNHLDQSREM